MISLLVFYLCICFSVFRVRKPLLTCRYNWWAEQLFLSTKPVFYSHMLWMWPSPELVFLWWIGSDCSEHVGPHSQALFSLRIHPKSPAEQGGRRAGNPLFIQQPKLSSSQSVCRFGFRLDGGWSPARLSASGHWQTVGEALFRRLSLWTELCNVCCGSGGALHHHVYRCLSILPQEAWYFTNWKFGKG